MRVLFWSETFWPRVGGVENLAARLLPALQERGYEFAVVTWEDLPSPEQSVYRGIPVYRLPFFLSRQERGFNLIMKQRCHVTEIKRQFAPELVHINSYGRSVLFHLNTVATHPAPALMTLHQPLGNEPVASDSLLGHLFRTVDWVNTCSDSVLSQARELLPEIVSRSCVIRNALEPSRYKPQPLPFDPPQLLCIGRLVPEKGFDTALTAFAAVTKHFPKARLAMVGDGPQRQNLIEQEMKLGLGSSVQFYGTVAPEKIAERINEATLVLVPSRLEGFGLVALEAALMARPVVAMNVGGLPEIVRHHHTGLLVEPENSLALAEAVICLLRNPDTALQMGQAARLRAQEVFNWQTHVNAYDDLYQKLATERRNRNDPTRNPFPV